MNFSHFANNLLCILRTTKARILYGSSYINYTERGGENSSGSFFPIACNSRREISSGSPAIRGVGDMFTENRISQDLIRFHRTVVPRAEFVSQELHVGINDSAFRSVFPVFFPLRDELDYRSCQAPLAPVLYFILFLC